MNDDKDDEPEGLPQSWAHLFPARVGFATPEEDAEARSRESKRRRGGNRNWWKKHIRPADNDG